VTLTFPTRPLTAHPPGHGLWGSIVSLAATLLAVVGLAWIAIPPIPDLIADWSVRHTAQRVSGGDIEHGKCQTWGFMVTCSGTLVLRRPGAAEIRQEANHYFVDFHTGDYTANVMADPANPTHLTTDLFLSKIWNRIVTLAISVPFFAAVAFWVVRANWKGALESRALRAALRDRPLGLVVMRMDSQGPHKWLLTSDSANGAPRRSEWRVPRKARPIVLDPGQRTVLGVKSGDAVHMPLDYDLRWVDLTKDERDAMLRVLRPSAAGAA
jgi:hypothetical protein